MYIDIYNYKMLTIHIPQPPLLDIARRPTGRPSLATSVHKYRPDEDDDAAEGKVGGDELRYNHWEQFQRRKAHVCDIRRRHHVGHKFLARP